MGRTLSQFVTQTFMLVLPLAAFVAYFRVEIVRLLFERGKFTAAMTEHVALVALCSLGVLMLSGIGSILSRGFYTSGRTHIPAAISMVGTGLYLVLAVSLSRVLGVAGVALAASLEFLFGFLAQVVILRRYYPSFSPVLVIGKCLEYGGWAGLSGLAVRWAVERLVPMSQDPLALFLGMVVGAVGIGVFYIAGLLLVQEPDCVALVRGIRRRLEVRSRIVASVAPSLD
jgi:putative peptidoglycan lipid II flippase